jgi:hypothetical protein
LGGRNVKKQGRVATYPFDPDRGVPFGEIQGGREGRIIQLGA